MRKIADSKGLAAIIDSLMFVCIISAIALLVLDSPAENEGNQQWDRSAMVHTVLVQSTIPMTELFIEGENLSEAPVAELLREAFNSGDQGLLDRLSRYLQGISDPLVEAPYHYQWIVKGANDEIIMGESAIPEQCDVTASKIELGHDESSLTSTLYLWIL